MNDKPLITVIVPIYNIEEYLPRCVRSIMAQTYGNLEILLVDDGSTDGTGQLCDRLGQEDSRIRVLHKENGGSSSARNLALDSARGAYVGFVDSDDYIAPDMYEKLWQGILRYHVSVAQTGRDEIDAAGRSLPNICEPPARPVVFGAEDFLRELLLHRGDCSFCTKLIARELFEGRRFPEGELNEDFWLLTHMLPAMGRILSLPGQSYHVFYRIGSNSRKAGKEEFSRVYGDSVKNADMVQSLVEENYPDLKDVAFRFGTFQRLEYMLHIPISQMRRDNAAYRRTVCDLRRSWVSAMRNPVLTGKNKVYHTLFAVAPRGVRRGHRVVRSVISALGGPGNRQ